MIRVALYARYSTDLQNAASIEDQIRICRERAEREGWKVVATHQDAAVSGSSVILHPGIQTLLRDARAGQFDMVLAEAGDRVSRDQADVATPHKHLQFARVPLVTLAEGEISELHAGLKPCAQPQQHAPPGPSPLRPDRVWRLRRQDRHDRDRSLWLHEPSSALGLL